MQQHTLLIIHERYGRYSGAEQHLAVVMPHFAKKYSLAFVYDIATERDEAFFDALCSQKVQLSFNSRAQQSYTKMRDILRQVQPALIYLNKCLSVPILQAILDSGIPCVRMVHDHEVYCMRGYKYFPWSRRICHHKAGLVCITRCLASVQRDRSKGKYGVRWVSYTHQQALIHRDQKLAGFFAISEYMRQELILQGYDEQKTYLFPPIPNPELDFLSPTFGAENVILFVGQIVRGKGLDCLIKALAQVKTKFQLIVCGSGSHKECCQQLAEDLGIASQVEFRGWIAHQELATYYTQATLLAMPSVWPEPFGMVGLEAMRYGLPVVGFDSGGISDWLKNGQNGFLIPWMDIPAMAERIEWLLSHKDEARQMGENGKRMAVKSFNFEDYMTRMQEVFDRLMIT